MTKHKSIMGYRKDSPYRQEPFIEIEGNLIDMSDTPINLLAIPDKGKPKLLKGGTGLHKFKKAKKVIEIPISVTEPSYQTGGISIMNGLAGEAKHPDSPFLNLKNFIGKYKTKKQMGGVFDYMSTLPLELQNQFVQDFESLDKNSQKELIEYFKGGYYQSGGVTEYPRGGMNNAELEDKETIQTPDGTLSKVTGKTHKQGGEEVYLPHGSLIFSDYLKVPEDIAKQVLGKPSKKKLSYADISKKFPTKPYLEILSDPESDEYQINTAQVKLASNLGKLNTLFFAQEKSKENKESKETSNFQKGGIKTFNWLDYASPTYNQLLPTEDYINDYPTLHTEPASTVSTGVVLNLPNRKIIQTINLPEIEVVAKRNETLKPTQTTPKGFKSNSGSRTKNIMVGTQSNLGNNVATPAVKVVPQNPLTKFYPNLSESDQPTISEIETDGSLFVQPQTPQTPEEQLSNVIIESNDDRSYIPPEKNKWWKNLGVSNKLAGTIADIGLALGDKLHVSEPILHDRTKTPLFSRFVNFDDKEAQRMFSLNIQQIQNSNLPEQVKRAQISELTSKYSDYQSKQDLTNLQRYEMKRERDIEKLQKYKDFNVDQRISDVEEWRQKKARIDELRDAFKAQRKSRVVNALKNYGDYTEAIGYFNQTNPNYGVNPITGKIQYKPTEKSNLTSDILSQYQQRSSQIDLGGGSVGRIIGNTLIITDKEGKVTTSKID